MKLRHALAAAVIAALPLALLGCGDNSSTPAGSSSGTPAANPAAGTAQQNAAKEAIATGQKVAAQAATQAAALTAAAKVEADKLMQDAATYLKDHKLDLADKAVTELEGLKPKLPPEYGPKIDDLRKAVDALKSGNVGGVKLPDVKLPG